MAVGSQGLGLLSKAHVYEVGGFITALFTHVYTLHVGIAQKIIICEQDFIMLQVLRCEAWSHCVERYDRRPRLPASGVKTSTPHKNVTLVRSS
jgi:hypothetical protein